MRAEFGRARREVLRIRQEATLPLIDLGGLVSAPAAASPRPTPTPRAAPQPPRPEPANEDERLEQELDSLIDEFDALDM